MAIRYLRAMGTCGFGESGSIEDVVKGEDILWVKKITKEENIMKITI